MMRLCNLLALVCDDLSLFFEGLSRNLGRCEFCGKNLWYENPGPECPGYQGEP